MKYELVEHCFGIDIVVGSNLREPKLNFIFAKLSFGMNMKGQMKP